MGKLCILGVDNDKILKDFVRAHVDYLDGEKVCISHWYPDYAHNDKTIRVYYGTRRLLRKIQTLLPQFLYRRLIEARESSEGRVHDALTDFFRRHEVDVILAEFGPTGAEIAPHARKLKIPLIVHFHGHDAHRLPVVNPLREKYRDMFRDAFQIVSVSRYMTDTLVSLGAEPSKIVTNPCCPRDSYFEITPDYRPTILALGRFTDIKANYLTLMAFRMVAQAAPEARLVMAGDGDLLECCRTLAQVWGLADRVDFPGAVPYAENPTLFAHACCFALHSVIPSYGDAEGTPVVIFEAQAAGLPVVSTCHAGIIDAVIHGETGFLVEEHDVDGMAKHMLQLVRDPQLCRTMGDNARGHVRANFSMQSHIACLQGVVDAARASYVPNF